jgi:hypothetical protein
VVVGALLVGWIIVQVVLLRSFFWPLHGGYLLLGVVLSHRRLRRSPEAWPHRNRSSRCR